MAMLASPEIISVLAKVENNQLDSITTAELVAADIAIGATTYLWDNSHYQYERGYITAEGWARIRNDIKGVLRDPFARKIIMKIVEDGQARPKVADVYKQIIKELDEEQRD